MVEKKGNVTLQAKASELEAKIETAASFISLKMKEKGIKDIPKIGIVLGSGYRNVTDEVKNSIILKFSEIPFFEKATNHDGEIHIGELEGKLVYVMRGRLHFYEGFTMEQITFPIRVMKKVGIEILFVTNAAGTIRKEFEPGNWMIINDHINFQGTNPLIGPNLPTFGERFPDMTFAYNRDLSKKLEDVLTKMALKINKGVYVAFTGPSFETPAEIKFAQIMGGDAVGMSTVPEVIVANHMKMKVVGISLLTNWGAGISKEPISDKEVNEMGVKKADEFKTILKEFVKKL